MSWRIKLAVSVLIISSAIGQQQLVPRVTFSQDTYSTSMGSEVTLLCLIDARDSPVQTVSWEKDGVPISSSSRHTITESETSSTLTIPATTVEDEGTYTCKATNEFGEGSFDALLTFNLDPLVGGANGFPFGDSGTDIFSGLVEGERVGADTNPFGGEQNNPFGSDASALNVFGDSNKQPTADGSLLSTPTQDAPNVNINPTSQPAPNEIQKNRDAAIANALNPGRQISESQSSRLKNSQQQTEQKTAEVSKTTKTKVDGNVFSKVQEKPEVVVKKPKGETKDAVNNRVRDRQNEQVTLKPETVVAPREEKDRIVGGVGGGGFVSVSSSVGACKEECLTETDSCYRPFNCTHYDHCFAHDGTRCVCTRQRCGFGTFWNPKISVCDTTSEVDCEQDPCLVNKMNLSDTYASGLNCRTYYRCNQFLHSIHQCCPEGYAYNEVSGICVVDDTCNIPCSEDELTYNPKKKPSKDKVPKHECFFRPIKGQHNMYWNEKANREQECAPPLVYRQDICVCANPIKDTPAADYIPPERTSKCQPVVSVDFVGNEIKNKAPGEAWLEIINTQITRSKKGAQYGRFNGRTSRIGVPMLNGVSLNKLLARLRFFSRGKGAESQVLFSNCKTDIVKWGTKYISKDLSPSVAVILNRRLKKLLFLGSKAGGSKDQVLLYLPYKPNDWNNVELRFDGSELSARVRVVGADKKAVEFKNSTALTGPLASSIMDAQVGRCNNEDGFFGYMDMVQIYKDCLP